MTWFPIPPVPADATRVSPTPGEAPWPTEFLTQFGDQARGLWDVLRATGSSPANVPEGESPLDVSPWQALSGIVMGPLHAAQNLWQHPMSGRAAADAVTNWLPILLGMRGLGGERPPVLDPTVEPMADPLNVREIIKRRLAAKAEGKAYPQPWTPTLPPGAPAELGASPGYDYASLVQANPYLKWLVPSEQQELLPPPTPVKGLLGPGNSRQLAAGLSRDDAVARMKALDAAGVRAQMQRQPDGSFAILRREAAQVPAKAPAPKVPAPVAGAEGEPAGEAGFQSRLLTIVSSRYAHEVHTPDEWLLRLRKDPNIPKSELEATVAPLVNFSGPAKPMSGADLAAHIYDTTPVARLERTVLERSGGPEDHPITQGDIDAEAEYLFENDKEWRQEEHQNMLNERDRHLKTAGELLTNIFGPKGGAAVLQQFKDAIYPEEPFDQWSAADLRDWEPEMPEEVDQILASLRHDPRQYALPGVRSEPDPIQLNLVHEALERVNSRQNEAVEHLQAIHDPDWDFYNQQARERLEEDRANNSDEYAEGNTQYHTHQRVDEEAPYREILLKDPALGAYHAPHFGHEAQGLIAHARGEIHGKTYLMIEGQSDLGQATTRRGASFPEAKHHPFLPTDKWAQLATGASLHQAAEEGLDHFSWVTPADRMRKANLAEESANITYGQAIPKAVERIFKWLGEPIETGTHMGKYPSIRLTPAMRQKILKAGVPALGAIPILTKRPQSN